MDWNRFFDGLVQALGSAVGYLIVFAIAAVLAYCVYVYIMYRIKRAVVKAVVTVPVEAVTGAASIAGAGAKAAIKHGGTALELGRSGWRRLFAKKTA